MNLTEAVAQLRTMSVSVVLDESDIKAIEIVLDTLDRSPVVVVSQPLTPTSDRAPAAPEASSA